MNEAFKQNIESVRHRISVAAEKSGRSSDDVTLIGVTKYVDAGVTREIVEAGCVNLGENRPQVLWDKAAELADLPIRWHMIGHLQRNKVKRTIEIADLVHSVDSPRLLTAINEAAKGLNKKVEVLLEFNVSGEAAKHGFEPDQISNAIEVAAGLSHVAVNGLMCMAGLNGDQGDARREFAMLRQLAESNESDSPANVELKELSMGMSGDFEIAIEEGATLVRVGSLLLK